MPYPSKQAIRLDIILICKQPALWKMQPQEKKKVDLDHLSKKTKDIKTSNKTTIQPPRFPN